MSRWVGGWWLCLLLVLWLCKTWRPLCASLSLSLCDVFVLSVNLGCPAPCEKLRRSTYPKGEKTLFWDLRELWSAKVTLLDLDLTMETSSSFFDFGASFHVLQTDRPLLPFSTTLPKLMPLWSSLFVAVCPPSSFVGFSSYAKALDFFHLFFNNWVYVFGTLIQFFGPSFAHFFFFWLSHSVSFPLVWRLFVSDTCIVRAPCSRQFYFFSFKKYSLLYGEFLWYGFLLTLVFALVLY